MTTEKKPRKPFEHKMDSDPEFLSSMEFVKANLRKQFVEWELKDKEQRRIKAEQDAQLEAARQAAVEQERRALIELERRVKRQVALEEKLQREAAKKKLKQSSATSKRRTKTQGSRRNIAGAFIKDYGCLTNETGVVVRVTNLCSFLRENGYQVRDTKSLKDVLEGKRYSFKGWTLVGGPVEGMTKAQVFQYIGWLARHCRSNDDNSRCGSRVILNQNR